MPYLTAPARPGLDDCIASRAEVDARRLRYAGARVRLVHMMDPYAPVAPGTTGTVGRVDDAGTLHVSWDDGRTLGLIPGADRFEVLVP